MMKQTMVEMSSDIHPEVLSLAVVQACCWAASVFWREKRI
jgi:hypothetical protein